MDLHLSLDLDPEEAESSCGEFMLITWEMNALDQVAEKAGLTKLSDFIDQDVDRDQPRYHDSTVGLATVRHLLRNAPTNVLEKSVPVLDSDDVYALKNELEQIERALEIACDKGVGFCLSWEY